MNRRSLLKYRWMGPASLVLSLSACVTEPARGHREVPPPPADARATNVWISAPAPRDTNANGYGDTISVTMFLFDEQRYPISLALPGAARFVLKGASGSTLATWNYSAAQVRQSLQSLPPGPGYTFELNLMDHGGDKQDNQEGVLGAEFIPENGAPVGSRGGIALRIGKTSQ